MEYLNFPIVALGTALICLIGVTIFAITQRNSIRSRDEQLVVARAQAYAMLELSQAGVLFLDREHKLMGEASSAAPELLGHTCGAGTAFVQVIAELVDVRGRRDAVSYLETLWKAEPNAMVDATQNPLARVHSGSRHLAIRFARLVVDGRVHHIIVSIERISAPRLVPHTIEVPVLDEETFARRLAGETGTRPALTPEAPVAPPKAVTEADAAEPASVDATPKSPPAPVVALGDDSMPAANDRKPLGPLDVTEDSLPSIPKLSPPEPAAAPADPGTVRINMREVFALSLPPFESQPGVPVAAAPTMSSPEIVPVANSAPAASQPQSQPDPSAIIDPPDARLSEVLKEIMHVEAGRLENFLAEARDKAGQLRAIIKLPARDRKSVV